MVSHETNISAQQKETKKNSRLPRPHEDKERPQGHLSQTQSGTQATLCLNRTYRFPKSSKLLASSEFRRVIKQARKWQGMVIGIDYLCGDSGPSKIGITVSRRFGNAVFRNRFKRIVREVFRQKAHRLPPHVLIHVFPRKKELWVSFNDILLDFCQFVDHEIPQSKSETCCDDNRREGACPCGSR